MAEFVFDVKLFAQVHVKADDEASAIAKLADFYTLIPAGAINLDDGAWEASADGEPDLIEVITPLETVDADTWWATHGRAD